MPQDYISLLSAIGTILTIAGYVWIRPRPTPQPQPKPIALKPILRDPLTYWLLGVNLIITLILPVQLIAEFPVISNGQSRYANSGNYLFYFRHYPHITVYPALFLGLAVLFAARAVNIYRAFSPRKAARRIALALIVALGATYWETTGHHMMLFEFNNDVQCGVGSFNDEDIVSKAKAIGLEDAVDPTRPMAQQVIAALSQPSVPAETTKMAKLFNNYDGWNELGVQWRSTSRTNYLTVFLCMTFVMLLGFCLLPYSPRSDKGLRDQDKVDASLSLNLLGGFFVYLAWIPFRIVSNLNTKIPLFGAENIYDNFFQQLPLVARFGITPADMVPVVAIPLFSTLLIFRIRRVSRKKTIIFLSACAALLVVGMAVLAAVNTEAFLLIFGITGNLKGLAFRVLIATMLLLLLYQYVGSIPRELDERERKITDTR